MTVLIETDRLQMREFRLDDVDAVYAFSTCPDVTQYTGDAGTVHTRQDAERLIKEVWLAEYEKYGYARYALVHKADQRVIGFCGIKFEPDLGFPDLGYRMLPEYWGKGLGTEAVVAILEYARDVLGLKNIVAEVVDDNTASSNLLIKVGFRHTGTNNKRGFTVHRYEQPSDETGIGICENRRDPAITPTE